MYYNKHEAIVITISEIVFLLKKKKLLTFLMVTTEFDTISKVGCSTFKYVFSIQKVSHLKNDTFLEQLDEYYGVHVFILI